MIYKSNAKTVNLDEELDSYYSLKLEKIAEQGPIFSDDEDFVKHEDR